MPRVKQSKIELFGRTKTFCPHCNKPLEIAFRLRDLPPETDSAAKPGNNPDKASAKSKRQ